MNKQLTRLFQISEKKERLIIGLMSGTSLDGLDVVLCKISGWGGGSKITLLKFETVEYEAELRERLRSIQSKEIINTRNLTILHSELGSFYGDVILEQLKEWKVNPADVDLIASHGQTVYHAPSVNESQPNSTLQIVDGDHIAQKTGIITISDFRQKHTALGGEGAPLAGIFDEVLFQHPAKNRMLLNLGGIANFTWLPSKKNQGDPLSGDIGPANTLINEAMQKHLGKSFDEDGKIASSGKIHSELLKYILLEPYFRKAFPKTTGQEDFKLAFVEDLMKGHEIELNPKDLIATLSAVTVYSISRAVDEIAGDDEFECFVSGGGVHNHFIMSELENRLPNAEFKNFEELGFSPDAKEAVMMAFFANELIAGEGFIISGVTEEKVHLGKISLPDGIKD